MGRAPAPHSRLVKRLVSWLVTLAALLLALPASALWGVPQKLPTPSATATDGMGTSVALSGDTVIVGAPGYGGHGAAFVFVRSGTTWTLQQKLVASDVAQSASFGAAVALSGDAAVVGAPDANNQQGAAYVFTRSGTTWTQVEEVTGMNVGDKLGWSVAIDGDTVFAGAPFASNEWGTTYVLTGAGGTWTVAQTLGDAMPTDAGKGSELGLALALSGGTAVVASPYSLAAPVVYVFTQSGTTWTQAQVLAPPSGFDQLWGTAVAVQGSTLVAASQNQLFVYALSGGTWTQTQVIDLAALGGPADFVRWIAIAGGDVLVGVLGSDNVGIIDVLAPSGGQLALQQQVADPGDPQATQFGSSLAVDGSTLIVGAAQQGEVFVFAQRVGDGEPCASAAECLSGQCVDGVCCLFTACPAAGPCNAAEHCQPGTGRCSVTPLNEGMSCTADACTQGAVCRAGACVGTTIFCPPKDACHEFGTCDASTGRCAAPPKPDGVRCPGGTCTGGVCVVPKQAPARSSGCEVGGTSGGGLAGVGIALVSMTARRRRRRARVRGSLAR